MLHEMTVARVRDIAMRRAASASPEALELIERHLAERIRFHDGAADVAAIVANDRAELDTSEDRERRLLNELGALSLSAELGEEHDSKRAASIRKELGSIGVRREELLARIGHGEARVRGLQDAALAQYRALVELQRGELKDAYLRQREETRRIVEDALDRMAVAFRSETVLRDTMDHLRADAHATDDGSRRTKLAAHRPETTAVPSGRIEAEEIAYGK